MSDTTHARGSRAAPAKQRTEWYAVSLLQSKHHLPFGSSSKKRNIEREKGENKRCSSRAPALHISRLMRATRSQAQRRRKDYSDDIMPKRTVCVFFIPSFARFFLSFAVIEVQAHASQNNGRPCRLWQFGFRLQHTVNA